MEKIQELFNQSAERHARLCPRQILGIRLGLYGGNLLGLDVPRDDKRLFVFSETDGCGTGGISVATNSWVDRRNMRIMDYGKVAATFVDTETGKAVRVIPHPESRSRAWEYAPDAEDNWHAMFEGYQVMPDEELMTSEPVELTVSMEKIISQPGMRAICDRCGEEICNQREVQLGVEILCRFCAGDGYYRSGTATISVQKKISKENYYATSNDNHPAPMVTLIGKSGSGKKTLLEKLIPELTTRGYRIATVKHHSHRGFDIDKPGKDRWRHAQAGSEHVVIAAPDKIARYRKLDRELTLDEIAASINDVDLILVEGYYRAGKPALEIVRAENSREPIGGSDQRFAVAADIPLELGVPQFGLEDVVGMADLIEERFLEKK